MMNDKQLVIIGAGGHGKVCADIAALLEYKKIIFLDDSPETCAVGKVSAYTQYLNDSFFFVAVGNSEARRRILEELQNSGAELVKLVHPAAVVSQYASVGIGSVVMAGAVVNTNAIIGSGVIINTASSVDHDCSVGDFSHVAVGAHVCGTVFIGDHVWIGAGATISNNVHICDKCIIGAGAVVLRDLLNPGTYVGVPARKIGL